MDLIFLDYLNFCFGLLEWEFHFLINWPLFNFIIWDFKFLHVIYSKYPFPFFLPLILALLLLSYKLHSVVGSPNFHPQCTIRPNTILQFIICSIPIRHTLLAYSSEYILLYSVHVPSMYSASETICNFTHFSITVLLNN